MKRALTIGEVARQSGVPPRTIRFYEAQGVIPAPARTAAGYRLYAPNDVRRLRLARRARLLGMALPDVKALVSQAFSSECGAYADQLLAVVNRQRAEVDRRIAELHTLRAELDALEGQVRAAKAGAPAGLTVASCGRCPLIDERTGGPANCRCDPPTDARPGTSPARDDRERSDHAMPQPEFPRDDVLEVLACEIGARPAGAPSPMDLVPFARALRREGAQLVITFDPAAAETVAAFAEAERRCCAGIGWQVEQGAETQLRITAAPAQLDVIEQAWPWTADA